MLPTPRGLHEKPKDYIYPSPPRELRPQVPPAVGRCWRVAVREGPTSPRWPQTKASPRRLPPVTTSVTEPAEEQYRRVSQDWGRRVVGVHEALGDVSENGVSPPLEDHVKQGLRRQDSVMTCGDELEVLRKATNWRRQQTEDVLAAALSPAPVSARGTGQTQTQASSHLRPVGKQQEPMERTLLPSPISPRASLLPSTISPRASIRGSVYRAMGATGEFWLAYRKVPREIRGPAWEGGTAREAIAEREEIHKEHKSRRDKLMRLINTGQLSEAASEATGAGRRLPPAIDKDEIGRQFEVLGIQRRELAETRKMLEKLVQDETRRSSQLGRHLSFILRGFHNAVDVNIPEELEQLVLNGESF